MTILLGAKYLMSPNYPKRNPTTKSSTTGIWNILTDVPYMITVFGSVKIVPT
jgi:hypothetical protein